MITVYRVIWKVNSKRRVKELASLDAAILHAEIMANETGQAVRVFECKIPVGARTYTDKPVRTLVAQAEPNRAGTLRQGRLF